VDRCLQSWQKPPPAASAAGLRPAPADGLNQWRPPAFECCEEAGLDVLIRAAELRDAPAIGTVWQRATLVGYEGILPADAAPPSTEVLTERSRHAIAAQRHNTLVLVACNTGPDGQIVGTVAAVPDPDQASRAELLRLYVDPGHWGRGIGRRLHDAALAQVRDAGYKVAVAWVLERNIRARAMYERWGWQATPARHTDYPGLTEICYLLRL
jgi:GNAT superfamily N-acetyltransferase